MITLPTAAGATTEYEDFYETTLLNPVNATDTDIYPTVLPSSAVGFLVLDPLGANPEIIFYNFKGANFVRVPSVTDGEGRGVGNTTPRGYDAGTKIGMYSIAEYFEGLANGRFLRDGFLQSRHFGSGIDPNSWIGTGETWNYVGSNGQREFQYVTAGDKRTKYQNGMKVRMPRVTTTIPTQRALLNRASSQYASRVSGSVANLTVTDDITIEATIKLTSYSSDQMIISRGDGNSGWWFGVDSTGRLTLSASNTAPGNYRRVVSNMSIPLNTEIVVAASLDMSGFTNATCKTFFDGAEVPSSLVSAGTNPTSFINNGTVNIGAIGVTPSNYYDGYVQEIKLWHAIRTVAQIKAGYHTPLVGNEANLAGYWKCNGNFNDTHANANHLTAQNGAVATNASTFFNSTEYGIIHDLSFAAGNTTITIFTGIAYTAPAENLSGISYSAASNPIGFNRNPALWTVTAFKMTQSGFTPGNQTSIFCIDSFSIQAPLGDWRGKIQGMTIAAGALGAGSYPSFEIGASYTTSARTLTNGLDRSYAWAGGNNTGQATMWVNKDFELLNNTANQPLYVVERDTSGGTNATIYIGGGGVYSPSEIRLTSAWI